MTARYVRASPDSVTAWLGDEPVTRARFEAHVAAVMRALPETRWIVNRCANRYHFAVTFLAACRRGATNLLPPGVGPQATQSLLAGYADAFLVEDPLVERALADAPPAAAGRDIADEHVAALVFTSGSTGVPQAHVKPWRALAMSARYCRLRLGERAVNVVATVPPQHMYGLEPSIFTLLAGDWALHCHMSHHTMNAMGHDIPNNIGVDQSGVQEEIRDMLPGFMAMGSNGMAEHQEHTQMGHMKGPENTLPMMTGVGPFGNLEMGGMFTVVKVRDNLARGDYRDPGWYKNPPGTVAQRVSSDPDFGNPIRRPGAPIEKHDVKPSSEEMPMDHS